MENIVLGVRVSADPLITRSEIESIVAEERSKWLADGQEIARIELSLEGEEIIVKTIEKSPIRRVRRITGYLSNMENFNDAKQDELAARKAHGLPGRCNCD